VIKPAQGVSTLWKLLVL